MFKRPIIVSPENDTFEHAVRFCSRSISVKCQGEQLIRQKLVERGYSPQVIERAIVFCREDGYLDDLRLANIVAENLLSTGRGAGQMVRQKLQRLGVGAKEIDLALATQGTEIDIEGALAEKIASKYPGLDYKKSEKKELQRVIGWAMRKGYSHSQVRVAIQAVRQD